MFRERECAFCTKIVVWIVMTVMFMTFLVLPQSSYATETEVEVTGANEQAEEVIDQLEENGGAILFAENYEAQTLGASASTDKVELSYSRVIYYENFMTRNFRVKYDGKTKVAYCVQPKLNPPAEGKWTATEYNNKLMTKALYYSYGYPGYDKKTRAYVSKRDLDEDYEDDDGAYVLSHLVLSYFYDKQSINSDAFLGVSSNTKNTVIKIANLIENTWPAVPDNSKISLNKTSVNAVWDKELQKQKTPEFKLNGHEDNRILVTVPKHTTMVRVSDGVTKKFSRGEDNSAKIKVFGGDTFYFIAPETVKGTFKSPTMEGNLSDFQPYLIKIEGKQNIIYCGVGETDSVSFEIKWTNVGIFEFIKASGNSEVTANNGCYSLESAEYEIYDSNGKLYEKIVTDKNGKASVKLPYGKYTYKESKAPKGYVLDEKTYQLKVDGDEDAMVKDIPHVDVPEMILHKKDKEIPSEESAQFGASLKDAEYSVKFYGGYYDEKTDFSKLKPLKKWTMKTDENGVIKWSQEYIVEGDEIYTDTKGNPALPLGTIVISEIKAPEGYILDEKVMVRQIVPGGGNEITGTYSAPDHLEQIIRGDIKFLKQAEDQSGFMTDIVFRITSKTTGESCQMKTDENGFATTEDKAWLGEESAKSKGKGALPYDTYIIDEIRSEKNYGYTMLENIEVVVDQNNAVVDLGILVNERIKLETSASETDTGNKNITASSKINIRDIVTYDGLEPGKEYVLKGKLIDKETGKIIENNGLDVEGETIFAPSGAKGTVNVDFVLNGKELEGKTLVVYEYLYDGGELIASHEDINSIAQTVKINSKESPTTGDNIYLMGIVCLLIVSLFGAVSIIRRE